MYTTMNYPGKHDKEPPERPARHVRPYKGRLAWPAVMATCAGLAACSIFQPIGPGGGNNLGPVTQEPTPSASQGSSAVISPLPTKANSPRPLYPQGRQWNIAAQAAYDATHDGKFTIARHLVGTLINSQIRRKASLAVQAAEAPAIVAGNNLEDGTAAPSLRTITNPGLRQQIDTGIDFRLADQATADALSLDFSGAHALFTHIHNSTIAAKVSDTVQDMRGGRTSDAEAVHNNVDDVTTAYLNTLVTQADDRSNILYEHTVAYDHIWSRLPAS